MQRFKAVATGGQRGGKRFSVLDREDKQGGKGKRRVSFHRTWTEARDEARRRNKEES